jgi:hypothetical protein
MGTHTFFSNCDRDFLLWKQQCVTSITSNKKKIKKIALSFETNDEHQARSYQNALRYSVIAKLS